MSTTEIVDNRTSQSRNGNSSINVNNVERAISIIGGGTALLIAAKRPSWGGLCLSLLAGSLLHRGITGHCVAYSALNISSHRDGRTAAVARDIHVEKSLTINRSTEELYAYWRTFENLPRIMPHLESVVSLDSQRSHWVAVGPAGKRFEWDAEIYNEKPNELIAWRSLPDSDVVNAGSVHFEAGPSGRGTQVTVVLNYNVAGGKLTAMFAKLFGAEPGQMIEEDLRRFKQLMEAGEIATIEGQPSGREAQEPLEEAAQRKSHKLASIASAADERGDKTKTQVA